MTRNILLLQLDDWVLCRIYNKKGSIEKHFPADRKSIAKYAEMEEQKPDINELSGFKNGGSTMGAPPMMMMSNSNDLLNMDTSDSTPRLHTDSSCSEHVLSPELTCEKEVQSQPKSWNDQLDSAFDFNFNYIDDGFQDDPFASQVQFQMDQLSPLQDMFMYLQRPLWFFYHQKKKKKRLHINFRAKKSTHRCILACGPGQSLPGVCKWRWHLWERSKGWSLGFWPGMYYTKLVREQAGLISIGDVNM